MAATTIRCPVCAGPAHDCGDGGVYCGTADVIMSAAQVQQALTARDIARRVIDGATLHQAVTAVEAEARLAELAAEVERREAP